MYRLRDKRKRNQAIRDFRRDNPEITLGEIGEIFHISKQRVHAILKIRMDSRDVR